MERFLESRVSLVSGAFLLAAMAVFGSPKPAAAGSNPLHEDEIQCLAETSTEVDLGEIDKKSASGFLFAQKVFQSCMNERAFSEYGESTTYGECAPIAYLASKIFGPTAQVSIDDKFDEFVAAALYVKTLNAVLEDYAEVWGKAFDSNITSYDLAIVFMAHYVSWKQTPMSRKDLDDWGISYGSYILGMCMQ